MATMTVTVTPAQDSETQKEKDEHKGQPSGRNGPCEPAGLGSQVPLLRLEREASPLVTELGFPKLLGTEVSATGWAQETGLSSVLGTVSLIQTDHHVVQHQSWGHWGGGRQGCSLELQPLVAIGNPWHAGAPALGVTVAFPECQALPGWSPAEQPEASVHVHRGLTKPPQAQVHEPAPQPARGAGSRELHSQALSQAPPEARAPSARFPRSLWQEDHYP